VRVAGPIDRSPEWAALAEHASAIGSTNLRELFASDPGRGDRLTAEAGDLYLDYSKHLVTDETLELLLALAERAGVRERRDAMFAGEHVNVTEDRPALHVALRMPQGS
jgi:glucose-6-phosphate isomerase